MRRLTAHAALAVIVGGLLSPVASLTTASPASADPYGMETTVAGGGDGLTGPASRARIHQWAQVDAAHDGSVLVTDQNRVLRLRPDTDTVSVVNGSLIGAGHVLRDVAAYGTQAIMASDAGLQRIASDGSATLLAANPDVRYVDVGSDGAVWFATQRDLVRIGTDGVARYITVPSTQFWDIKDLAVTPDGTTAYVLDNGISHDGIYQATATGVGARVAGNPGSATVPADGLPATAVSTMGVRGLTTDGTTITFASQDFQQLLRFPVGGTLTAVAGGAFTGGLTVRGTELIAACWNDLTADVPSLHRLSATGTDLGRVLGADPEQPWSPDGVLASDAFLDDVRGGAALPDGRTVFSTAHGLVRETDAQGLLHTRATLDPIRTRGKVAVSSDGTAYVVTDAGGVVKVPSSGALTALSIDADVTDVEAEADGTLLVADARGNRLLRVPTDGGDGTVLAGALHGPSDIGLDGDTVLVADTGLRRVGSDGTVSTLLSDGNPTSAAMGRDGVWTDPDAPDGRPTSVPAVLRADGQLSIVRADAGSVVAQVQAVGNGDVLATGGTSVRLVTDAGLPDLSAPTVTATPGSGRIRLTFDQAPGTYDLVVGRAGQDPPTDRWDGDVVTPKTAGPGAYDVLRVGDHVLQPGEQWSFAVFGQQSIPLTPYVQAWTWSAGSHASATVGPDTTPPQPPVSPSVSAGPTQIWVGWQDPRDDDFDHSVLRMSLGTAPPASPEEGTELGRGTSAGGFAVPDPVPGQDYGLSIFTVDTHGNYSVWSTVTRLDVYPPAPVTDLSITPSYTSADIAFTPPPDPDYARTRYAVAQGSDAPSCQTGTNAPGPGGFTVYGLTMGATYTIAVCSLDLNSNMSDPTVAHFSALVDTQPPGPVTTLASSGGDYQVTATWVPPTDGDLANLTARLTDSVTGAVTSITLAKTAITYTWPRLAGGRSYTVAVVANDVHGLTSDVSTSTAQTYPDANGTPPAIDPASVTVTPRSTSSVTLSFPRPAIPDLKSLGFAVLPLGQDPTSYTTLYGLATTTSGGNLSGVISLPQPLTGFQVVLFVWDFNDNRAVSVLPEVAGTLTGADLPVAPAGVSAQSPGDNVISVVWAGADTTVTRATNWTVTATSGSLTRTVTVPGSFVHAQFTDLAGRQNWTVRVTGTNGLGAGPPVTTAPIVVADNTAPMPVAGATRTPAADTELLTWVNPTAFDFDHVVVTRVGATPAETQVVYQGSGTSARATGLLPGHAYSFEIRAYDSLGNVATDPVTLTTLQSALTLSGPTAVLYGAAATLTGSLTWNGTHPAGRVLSVQALPYGTTAWTQVAVTTTSTTGSFAAAVRPSVNTQYRIGYAGADGMGGGYSAARLLGVAPTMTIGASANAAPLGGAITIVTTVTPRRAGSAVLLQHWVGTGWVSVAVRTLSSTSTASVIVRPPTRGMYAYRWVTPASAAYVAGFGAPRWFKIY